MPLMRLIVGADAGGAAIAAAAAAQRDVQTAAA
jgi:hypothetical protein